jgi:hypothetical protein
METVTLMDVIVVLAVYGGLSLVCQAGRWLIDLAWPRAADRKLDAVVATGPRPR